MCLRQEGACANSLGGRAASFLSLGDGVIIYSRFTLQPLLRTRVVAMDAVPNATIVTFEDSLPAEVVQFSQLVSVASMPRVSITGSRFASNRARGILCGTTGVSIMNNRFEGVSGAAFKEQPGNYEYAESTFLQDFIFADNHIIEVNEGAAQMPGSVWISSWRSTFDQNGDPTATGRPLRSGTAMRNISLVRNTFVQNRSAVTLPAVAVDSIAQLNVSNNAVRYTGDPEAETSPLAIAITSSTAVTTEDNTCSWEGRADANCNVSSTPPVPTVDNARPRVDGNGAPLDSHDAGPFQIKGEDGVFLLGLSYGHHPLQKTGCADGPGSGKAGFRLDHNVSLRWAPSVASSVWTFKASLLPADRPSGIYWRPKLLRTATNGYVLWVRRAIVLPGFTSGWHTWNTYMVLRSRSLLGPYEIVNENATVRYPEGSGGGGGDFALFQDDDKSCFIAYTGGEGIVVEKLDPTCTRSAGEPTSEPMHSDCEAPALFKRATEYYLVFGQKCCFCDKGSGVHVYRGSSPRGPFKYQGQINRLGNGSAANPPRVNAQQAAVTLVNGVWMWIGDRWQHARDGTKGSDPQAWLPLEFESSGSIKQLQWQSSWPLASHLVKTDDGTKSKSTGFVAFTATGTCVCRADHSKNKWCNYSDANGLVDPDNFDCRNYRNLVEMAQVSIEAFGDEWNRTVPCALHGDAADPRHDLCDFHGSWPTSGLLKQAKGRRVLWLDFAAAARDQLGSISAHPKDAVVLANASACPEEGLFTGIWWDHGAAAVAAQAEVFFPKLRAAGGSVDQMVLDFEAGMLTPDACAAPYAGGVPGVPKTPANQRSAQACRACAAEKWRAIQNDDRFALDLPKLKEIGLRVDETQHDYLVDAMMRWQCNGGQWPHAMTACVNDQTNDTNRKVWNSCERSTHCAFSISARNCCSLANAQSFAFRHSPASV